VSVVSEPGVGVPVLSLRELSVLLPVRPGNIFRSRSVPVLNGVSLDIHAGEIFCLVGESGAGKTTLLDVILGFCVVRKGTIRFRGREVEQGRGPGRLQLNRSTQVVFQDPVASLSPFRPLGRSIVEPLQARGADRAEMRKTVRQLCRRMQIPRSLLRRRPSQVSAGQAQKICIARALSTAPDLLLLDEPLSALDNPACQETTMLLCRLQREYGLTCLLVSHDLRLVRAMATTVAVLYLGRIVEQGPADSFFERPAHPYSRALLSSALVPGLWPGQRIVLEGEMPSPLNAPAGCPFHPRCPERYSRCSRMPPPLRHVRPNHFVLCHRAGQGSSVQTATGHIAELECCEQLRSSQRPC